MDLNKSRGFFFFISLTLRWEKEKAGDYSIDWLNTNDLEDCRVFLVDRNIPRDRNTIEIDRIL
jgi:hypothetical protein